MTKTKTPPVYGDQLPITPFQIKRIMANCQYNVEIKNEWVQWVTGDVNLTSLKSITQAQAVKIMHQQTGSTDRSRPVPTEDNWALFDKNNKQHLAILAQMRTLQWVTKSDKWGEVADMDRLSSFLKSDKSPVKKPLKKMTTDEVSKIIECFKSMIVKRYK